MAMADYYSCDLCGAKTFYDANLDWESGYGAEEGQPYPVNPVTEHPWPCGNVGFMLVFCRACTDSNGGTRALWFKLIGEGGVPK